MARLMLRALRNLYRLFTIGRVLARNDALFLFELAGLNGLALLLSLLGRRRRPELRPGQKLAAALEQLGPTFIKLGQALSTRSDLLGEQMAEDLSGLQDRLPPFPAAQARKIIEEELGQPLEQAYSQFGETAIAAASIAQVHFAVTSDGQEVAVKILRPGVEAAFARDIGLFYWLAEWAVRLQPQLRRLKPVESVKAFEDAVELEMDLRFEAAAAAEMADNFADDDSFNIPAVDWQRTARRVLTLERVNGIPIYDRDAILAAGLDMDAILSKSADAFFNQVFRDGFFHADMHPGNLFVDTDGNLVAVDFGITGRIDQRTRRFLGEMLLGFLTGNYRRVAEVHFEAGFVPADKSVDNFTQACRSIAEPIMGKPLHEISVARLLGQLFQITETFAMETQPQLLLLQKSMLVAEGVGRQLDPRVNMWQLAQPRIEQWMRANLGPEARIRDGVSNLVSTLERLPKLVSETERTASLLSEGVRLHPDSLRALGEDRSRRPLLPNWLPWLLVGVLSAVVALK